MMKTPKILPWLARKAGISDVRAEELWTKALRHATAKTGWVGTSEYWRTAVDKVIELIEREAKLQCQPRLPPMVRFQTRMWMLPMIAWHGYALVGSAAWARLTSPRRHAL